MNTFKKLTAAALVAATFSTMTLQTQALAASADATQPAALPAGVTQGPTVEGITEYRLANGLRVVLFPDASKATATVNMTYLVGSRQENYGETGMAHLLEHLMFKGSKNYPDPSKEFTRRGFRMNGTTWLDRTNYFVSFTASDDNLRWALGWSADAMRNSFIAQKDLDSEMSVVRNEYEMGENNPMRVMMKRMQSVLFDWHNYGKSTIGNRSDIENVRIDNLRAFYSRYYRPDNAVLTVSGKFDVAQTLRWIAQDFGKIENPPEALPPEWTVEPAADGQRSFEIRRPGGQQLVAVAYRIPSALHADAAALEAATEVLVDEPSGRLYDALVKTGLATQVFGYVVGAKAPGYAMFIAVVKKDEPLEAVKSRMIETIEGALQKQPITDKELGRVKAEAATLFERAFADPEKFGVQLSDYIALGDWRLFFYGRDQFEKLTAEQAEQAAKRYFVRDNRVVGLFIPDEAPQRATIPQTPSAAELLAKYEPRVVQSEAEAFDATYDNINARTVRFDVGDLKVALLPKKNRGQTVTVIMRFRNGDLQTRHGKRLTEDFLGMMLDRGTADMTHQDIQDAMTHLKMDGDVLEFVTTGAHLSDALNLSAKVLHEASFPESEFDQVRKQLTVSAQAARKDPAMLAQDAITRHFNTYPLGDIRHKLTIDETLEALKKASPKELKAYQQDILGTARGEITIVGDFDAKATEALIKTLFPPKVSKSPYARSLKQYKPVAPVREVIDTPQKENAVIMARATFKAQPDAPDAEALKVANWILGGGTGLSNRLIDRLRQKEGLSYGAGSGVKMPNHGDEGSFTFQAIVAPQNLLKAEASAKDEIERAVRDGFTDKEVQEAKKGLLQAMAVARAQDSVIATGWMRHLDNNRDWRHSAQKEAKIRALTTEEVNAALRKYIKPAEITWVLAGDASKAGIK